MLHLATIAAVIMLSGYEYFGNSFLNCFCVSSSALVTALYNSGAVRVLNDSSSRFVANDVFTFAPFSYVTDAPTGIVHELTEEEEEKSVNVGPNKKNRMPLSAYHLIISARIEKGGLSTTMLSFSYLNF